MNGRRNLNWPGSALATLLCLTFAQSPASFGQTACKDFFRGNTASPSDVNDPRVAPTRNHFVESDFPSSNQFSGTQDRRFSSWAAMQATSAVGRLGRGDTFEHVLEELRAARRFFQYDWGVGEWRWSESDSWTDFRYARQLRARFFWLQRFRRLLYLNPNYSIGEPVVLSAIRANPQLSPRERRSTVSLVYHTRNGQPLPGGRIELIDGMELTIHHPTGPVARVIFLDSMNRIHQIQSSPTPKRDFALSMRGYFISMPFYRGSAAIGRIAFAALYSRLFHRAISLPASVDSSAMIMSEADFLEFIEPYLN